MADDIWRVGFATVGYAAAKEWLMTFVSMQGKASAMLDLSKAWFRGIGPRLSETTDFLLNPPSWLLCFLFFVVAPVVVVLADAVRRLRKAANVKKHTIRPEIKEAMKPFLLTDDQLRQSMCQMRQEIDKGLNPATKQSSSIKCFTTYVQDLPTGKEDGKFLALDLGGSNFRVLLVNIHGRYSSMKSKIYAITQEIMTGPGEALFDHIANCLEQFVQDQGLEGHVLPLGFTFSFPLMQVGLKSGVLQRWTKGFNCPGVVGQDVVLLLKKAVDKKRNLNIETVAVLNDTTGTLMSCAWKNKYTSIGVILGTGTNACYVERIENIPGFDGDKSKPYVLVNTEWGAYGDNGMLDYLCTSYDNDIDKRSINPGKQR